MPAHLGHFPQGASARRRVALTTVALLLALVVWIADAQTPSKAVVTDTYLVAGRDDHSFSDAAATCAAARFPGQCLTLPGCQWCCDGASETPCFLASGDPLGQEEDGNATLGARVLSTVRTLTSRTCAAHAALRDPSRTCADLCYDAGNSCEMCEQRNWCYFCRSSRLCMSPRNSCRNNAFVQQCALPAPDLEPEIAFWKVVLTVATGSVCGSAILIVVVCAFTRYRTRVRRLQQLEARRRRHAMRQQQRQREQEALLDMQRQQQEQQQQEGVRRVPSPEPQPPTQPHLQPPEDDDDGGDERRPLLQSEEAVAPRGDPHMEDEEETNWAAAQPPAPTGGDALPVAAMSSHPSSILDDEAVCYLCLDARPSVAFLPCYHACCCEACSNRLRPRAAEVDCPFCRRKIEAMVSLSNILQLVERNGTS